MQGRWFQGPEDDEVTIEWTSRKQLVQHILKSSRCTEGQVQEFHVRHCRRRPGASMPQNNVEGHWFFNAYPKSDAEGWQPDNRLLYSTVGWRRGEC